MTKKITKEGLYIHIPFCQYICSYCSFCKVFYSKNFVSRYLKSLEIELKKYDSFSFKSIYIGGGTPTSLSLDELTNLFNIIKPYQAKDSYITIESNPDITLEKIKLLKELGVKRVSLGVQTFNKKYLKLIERESSYSKIKELIAAFNDQGINNINIDLIYGFNGQTLDELIDDLKLFTSLNVQHISTYCLEVSPSSKLYNQGYEALNEDDEALFYKTIVDYLAKAGFHRYEISNFAPHGYESKHNLIYWNNLEYGGVGLGASSYIDKIRYTNTKSLTKYLNNQFDDYKEIVTEDIEKFYEVMLSLRLERGLDLKKYQNKFHEDFLIAKEDVLKPLINNNELIIEDGYLRLNKDNFFIIDFYLRKLLF